ncbi:MAG: DNA-processing protein DprA [Lentisphaeria bacterium]|nr:DNA-processing protein DprA [Lentisphaeria bacterium]
MTNKDAYILLNLLPQIGPKIVATLLNVFAQASEILQADEAELAKIPGIGAKRASILANWTQHTDLDAEWRAIEEHQCIVLTPDDDEYPLSIKELELAPLCLYVKGNLQVLEQVDEFGLSIVGSRHISLYGEQVCRNLTRDATYRKRIIVSGLARGIDTVAHEETIEHGGYTIAVIGSGLANIYPKENIALAMKIIDQGGAIISELPMRQRPDRRTFPMRNRIIAAISPATIVVEAGVNSGSIITAERAIEFKKDLYAVPGRIDTPHSQGCNELIQKGAKLLMSIDDIKESDTFLPGFDLAISENASTINANEKNQPGPKDPIQASLFSKIRNEGELSFENLSKHSQLTVSDLLTILMDMELEGYIKQLPGQRFAILSE